MKLAWNNIFSHGLLFSLSCRGLGPWGPDLVRRYTTARFSMHTDDGLTEEESQLLTGSNDCGINM